MRTFFAIALVVSATFVSTAIAEAGSLWTSKHTALNARSGPGTSYHVLRKFSPCTKVQVIKWSHGWVKVGYKGHHYWVSGKYTRNKPCNAVHHVKVHKHFHKHGKHHGHNHAHKHGHHH